MRPRLLYQRELAGGVFQTWDGAAPRECARLRQCHSDKIIRMEEAGEEIEGDGLIATNSFATPLAILTADCLPVALWGDGGRAFLHAGHRGIRQGIHLREEVVRLRPSGAFIGPHIRSCCFEVGPDFRELFPDSRDFHQREGRIYFDLQGRMERDLKERFPRITLDSAGLCTCCDLRFSSWRRDGTVRRNWNLFCPTVSS